MTPSNSRRSYRMQRRLRLSGDRRRRRRRRTVPEGHPVTRDWRRLDWFEVELQKQFPDAEHGHDVTQPPRPEVVLPEVPIAKDEATQ